MTQLAKMRNHLIREKSVAMIKNLLGIQQKLSFDKIKGAQGGDK